MLHEEGVFFKYFLENQKEKKKQSREKQIKEKVKPKESDYEVNEKINMENLGKSEMKRKSRMK